MLDSIRPLMPGTPFVLVLESKAFEKMDYAHGTCVFSGLLELLRLCSIFALTVLCVIVADNWKTMGVGADQTGAVKKHQMLKCTSAVVGYRPSPFGAFGRVMLNFVSQPSKLTLKGLCFHVQWRVGKFLQSSICCKP